MGGDGAGGRGDGAGGGGDGAGGRGGVKTMGLNVWVGGLMRDTP